MVRATIVPEIEENFELSAFVLTKLVNVKTHS
jgi:hypothetical protein